jgi:hypothetical protein
MKIGLATKASPKVTYLPKPARNLSLALAIASSNSPAITASLSKAMGSTATGLGAVFNDRKQDRFGFDADDDDKW